MIKQATIETSHKIEEILQDAVNWMRMNGLENQWNESNITWNHLSQSFKIEDFYFYEVDHQAAGCVAFTDQDRTYWPDVPKGESLFLHKLAVKREFAGRGISKELIQFGKQLALSREIHSIRLDCNGDRSKLRKLYEQNGFQLVREITTSKGCNMALYQLEI